MRVPVYCSSRNPLGHSISAEAETSPAPDSARSRFLVRAGIRSAPDRVNWRGHDPATRGAGDICLPWRLAPRRGRPNQLQPPVPRLPGIIPAPAPDRPFRPPCAWLFYQGTRAKMDFPLGKVTVFFLTTYSPPTHRCIIGEQLVHGEKGAAGIRFICSRGRRPRSASDRGTGVGDPVQYVHPRSPRIKNKTSSFHNSSFIIHPFSCPNAFRSTSSSPP